MSKHSLVSQSTLSTVLFVTPYIFYDEQSPKSRTLGIYRAQLKKSKLDAISRATFTTTRRVNNRKTLSTSLNQVKQATLYDLFDINFLKKERLYTKLKYSRSPAYDIVSGGAAALLAGFIGFLISEKFGIELVDSGDFYIAFMYAVFASFSLRPLLKILSYKETR
jgi:hypothetical protein